MTVTTSPPPGEPGKAREVDRPSPEDQFGQSLQSLYDDYTRYQLVEYSHDFTKEYILAADRKASILFTGLFALLGLALNAVPITAVEPDLATLTLTISALVFLGAAMMAAGLVLYPRKYEDRPGGHQSNFLDEFVYWERICAHGTAGTFVDSVDDLDAQETRTKLAEDLFRTAHIASGKYSWLRLSMLFTALMLGFGVASLTSYYQPLWLAVFVLLAVILTPTFFVFRESPPDV